MFGYIWQKLSKANLSGDYTGIPSAMSWDDYCEAVKNLPNNQIWRNSAAGDLPGENEKIDAKLLNKLVEANKGKRGFGYSHKNVLGNSKIAAANRKAIASANFGGFTINLSANNLNDADEKMALNIAPVVCILPKGTTNKFTITPAGNTIFTCPATMPGNDDKKVNCSTCGLCAKSRQDRKNIIIGFPAHGTAINKADKVARGESI